MAQQHFNTGSNNNDGTGDTLREAFIKAEENFNELYNIANTYPFPYTGDVDIEGSLQASISIAAQEITASILNPLDNTLPRKQYTSISNPDNVRFELTGNSPFGLLTFLTTNSRGYFQYFGNSSLTSTYFYIGPTSTNIFQVRGSLTNNLIYIKHQSPYNVGIDTTNTSHKLTINGNTSSSEYIGTLPTSDPNTAGQWFTTSSNEIFGDGQETQIICISQG